MRGLHLGHRLAAGEAGTRRRALHGLPEVGLGEVGELAAGPLAVVGLEHAGERVHREAVALGDGCRGLRASARSGSRTPRPREVGEALGQRRRLLAAVVGEVDAGRAPGQQRARLLGHGVAHEHERGRLGRFGAASCPSAATGAGSAAHVSAARVSGDAAVSVTDAMVPATFGPAFVGYVPTGPYSAGMSEPVGLSGGPPETVLSPEPADALAALDAALARSNPRTGEPRWRDVVARWPRFLDAWARLGELARDDVEAYAYFRVGYHRGLDRLRQSGWRGSGYVRWRHPTNRASSARSTGCAPPPPRSVSTTRSSAAPSSSTSSTRNGSQAAGLASVPSHGGLTT